MPFATEYEQKAVKPAKLAGGTNHLAKRNHRQRSEETLQRLSGLLEQTHIIPAVRAPEFLARSASAPVMVRSSAAAPFYNICYNALRFQTTEMPFCCRDGRFSRVVLAFCA